MRDIMARIINDLKIDNEKKFKSKKGKNHKID
jgi:hypothetical protein